MHARGFVALRPRFLAVFIGLCFAPTSVGQPVHVLTYDDAHSSNPFATSTGYSQLRSDLFDTNRFGPGGTVPRTVAPITSVSVITPAALAGIDVVIIASVNVLPTPAESSALAAFVSGGGGLVVADNAAAIILQPILGVTPGAPDSSGVGTVSNALSVLVNGPFGSFPAGTTVPTGFAGSFAANGLTPAGTGAMTNSQGFLAASFVSGGHVAGFCDEEMFANGNFVGGNSLLTPTSEAIFLNSFAFAIPVPEPSALMLVGAAAVALWRGRRVRRNH